MPHYGVRRPTVAIVVSRRVHGPRSGKLGFNPYVTLREYIELLGAILGVPVSQQRGFLTTLLEHRDVGSLVDTRMANFPRSALRPLTVVVSLLADGDLFVLDGAYQGILESVAGSLDVKLDECEVVHPGSMFRMVDAVWGDRVPADFVQRYHGQRAGHRACSPTDTYRVVNARPATDENALGTGGQPLTSAAVPPQSHRPCRWLSSGRARL